MPKNRSADLPLQQPDYSLYAKFYDYFELAGHEESEELNIFLHELFSINGVKTVTDLACGTGAQSIGLARRGYRVIASDLNMAMLQVARKKAGRRHVLFVQSDMRRPAVGQTDAVICIFNAIGHLSRNDCDRFLGEVYKQLDPGGIFVFDILNFSAMKTELFREYESMSREAIIDGLLVQHARQCRLDRRRRQIGIESITRWQDGRKKPGQLCDNWTMQIYDADELKLMLEKAGFREMVFFGPTGTEFDSETSDSILAVCQK